MIIMARILLSLTLLLVSLSQLSALPDEGIWIPLLIEKYNIRLMKEKGFKLSSDDIYSINRASMKDAVVNFNGGCTAGFISGEGLLITNHHCGYESIQEHSTLIHDYLTNGFWAMSKSEELPNPGMKVTLLKQMEDVTDKVLNGIEDDMDNKERDKIISSNINEILIKAREGNDYEVVIRPFYMGNQYFLFINEVFTDVRLVGAPPSSIGKFGGDTDNWIWPRHTGDFSLFRVYAGKNNKPASFSPENVPYKPAYFFPVSLKGVNEGDFTMVIGYPGTTMEYVSSDYIETVKNYINPKLIGIRTKKIEIMDEAMKSDPLLRIQYSSKKAGISNSWKKWIGEINGLERMQTIEKKRYFENLITEWIDSDSLRKVKYGQVLPSLKSGYVELKEYRLVNSFTNEVLSGIESLELARKLKSLTSLIENRGSAEDIRKAKNRLTGEAVVFFKDYNRAIDMKLFSALMKMYGETLDEKWQAPAYRDLKKKYRGDFCRIAEKTYEKSPLADSASFRLLVSGLDMNSIRRLKKDPLFAFSTSASNLLSDKVKPELARLNSGLQQHNRIYMKAQMEYQSDRILYPDANSTLRIAYGNVAGYFPADGVFYKPFTTLKGIMEKDNPEIYDYIVPQKLKELYNNHNYGRYGNDGELIVCFIANNHTTGGNSGSPVLDSWGRLIGLNFDRAWEGVASDISFSPDQSRNISLDIRYALFIIDKFSGAGYLLDEMTIIE